MTANETIRDAIDTSRIEDRIVYLEPDCDQYDDLYSALLTECDDRTDTRDEAGQTITEFWGSDWRIHLADPCFLMG